jgi:PTS system ascorbate-specific IIA component
MVSLLIVAHGTLGASLISCASHVFGERPALLEQVCVAMHDDPDEMYPYVRDRVRALDKGGGVLILTDIFGATPSNIATRLREPGHVEVIAGVNLPMLVRALSYRTEPLAMVVEKALAGAHEGILPIGEKH